MDHPNQLRITSSPHIHEGDSTARIMWSVVLCLVPAGAWGVYNFGPGALAVILVSIAAAVLTELVVGAVRKNITVFDGSAFLTGLLVGYNMPPSVPGFIPVAASVFAIAVVKHTFGGLGRNWMNPALAGRVFAMFCWTEEMTGWSAPLSAMDAATGVTPVAASDAVTSATPLARGAADFLQHGSYLDLFLGRISGCIGEVSALLLLAGTIYLFIRKIITWEIPAAYIGTFTLLVWIFGGIPAGSRLFQGDVLFHFLSGGLILGAFYMATDMVTSPVTRKGMLVFGAGCGFFTFVIRIFGGFPEGVSLAIIIMNIFVPLINRLTKPVKFGYVKEETK
ncbi:MAG: RnfABCDGE type electron transport complex subunit D [Spirochaetales bacterium]|nr:RnfABCDGE type electron transport complex subunit D [Spirochaetales bacterium]